MPIVLGILTSIGISWGIAASQSIPSYPRTTVGSFAQWDRPWQIAGAGSFGAFEWWWMDLHADVPARPVQDWISQMRDDQAKLIATRPGTIERNVPPTWGMFAGASPPPDDLMIGADAGFGWPYLCMWDQITGKLTGN